MSVKYFNCTQSLSNELWSKSLKSCCRMWRFVISFVSLFWSYGRAFFHRVASVIKGLRGESIASAFCLQRYSCDNISNKLPVSLVFQSKFKLYQESSERCSVK